jgi:hypothetical protein
MDPPPRRYWAYRMSMRPWQSYLAEILQFQCQLSEVLTGSGDGTTIDPCAPAKDALGAASALFGKLQGYYADFSSRLASLSAADRELLKSMPFFAGGIAEIGAMKDKLTAMGIGDPAAAGAAAGADRILIDWGFVELPSAGYLPVVPGAKETVNSQVRRLMGPGVDLRFCVVTPDYVPHALEMRQHMDRITLLDGIVDPTKKPKVDILVPNGTIVEATQAADGRPFEVTLFTADKTLPTGMVSYLGGVGGANAVLKGAGRSHALDSGGAEFHFAGMGHLPLLGLARMMSSVGSMNMAGAAAAVPAAPAAVPNVDVPVEFVAKAAGAAVAARAKMMMMNRTAGTEPAATTPASDSAFSAEARCQADPFVLPANAPVPISFSLYAGAQGHTSFALDIEVNGTGFVTSPATPAGPNDPTVTVKLSFPSLAVNVSEHGSSQVPLSSAILSGTATLGLAKRTDGGSLLVTMQLMTRNAKAPINQAWQWLWTGPNPLDGVLQPFEVGPVKPPLWLALHENAAVADVTNGVHVLAESALDIVAAALHDSAWRAAAEDQLFPKPPPSSSSIDVQATLDWVLFARRRLSSCSEDRPAPATAPPRRYQVFEVDDTKTSGWDGIRRVLLDNNAGAIAKYLAFFTPIDVIEFPGDAAALSADAGSLALQDWSTKATGDILDWAGVTPISGAERAGIEVDRLSGYESLLSSKLTVANAKSDVIPVLPTAFSGQGYDGIIVMATKKAKPIVTVEYVLRVKPIGVERLRIALDSANAELVLLSIIKANELTDKVGEFEFELNKGTAVDAAGILAAWNAVGDGGVAELRTYFTDPAAAGTETQIAARAASLVGAVGNTASVDPNLRRVSVPLPKPVVSVLFPAVDTLVGLDVYRVEAQVEPVTLAKTALTQGKPALLAQRISSTSGNLGAKLGGITYKAGSAAPKGDTSYIAAAWKAASSPDLDTVWLAYPPTSPGGDSPDIWAKRAASVAHLTKATSQPTPKVTEAPTGSTNAVLFLIPKIG